MSKGTEIPALGRHVELGMLYDMSSHRFLHGMVLWKQELIKKGTHKQNTPDFRFSVMVEDSLKSNTDMFNMEASMKASFLGGMVSVAGSASFLDNHMESENQCRLVMTCAQETKFESVRVQDMGDVIVPEVFQKQQATHVVIGIYYGAKAFMVCEKFASSSEHKREIMLKLEAAAEKLGSSSEGSGSSYSASLSTNFSQEQREVLSTMKCKYHGDVTPSPIPTSFDSAVSLVNKFPEFVKANGDGEPVRVILHRLRKIEKWGPYAPRIVNPITLDISQDLEDVFEELRQGEIKANDLIDACKDLKANTIQDKVTKFQKELREYRDLFQRNLKKLLPLIRRGKEQMQKLEDIIKFHEESLFSQKQMLKWLNEKKNEITLLKNMTKDFTTVPDSEVSSHTNDVSTKWLYVLSFTSLEDKEPYLSTLSNYVDMEEFKKMENISVARESFAEVERATVIPWYERSDVKRSMKTAYDEFLYWVPRYKGIITYKSDPAAPGAKLKLYNYGELTNYY